MPYAVTYGMAGLYATIRGPADPHLLHHPLIKHYQRESKNTTYFRDVPPGSALLYHAPSILASLAETNICMRKYNLQCICAKL